jgi:hypothetical protein
MSHAKPYNRKEMKHMPSIINRGLSSATTEDWLNATKDMKLSASDPCPRDLWASFVVNPERAALFCWCLSTVIR